MIFLFLKKISLVFSFSSPLFSLFHAMPLLVSPFQALPQPAQAARALPFTPRTTERICSALVAAAISLSALISSPNAALADALPSISSSPPSSASSSSSTPSTTTTTTSFASTPYTDLSNAIDYGLTADGRIRPCPGAIPNCVSISSTTALYVPALRAEAATPARAAALLDGAVAAGLKGEKIFEGAARGDGVFLQYEVPGASGRVRGPQGQPTKDVVEVLLRPERRSGGSSGGGENGKEKEKEGVDTILTYRSVADPDSIRFLPLLQQPLTDGGAQKTRMRDLLVGRLGWRAIGCDTLDCFFE